MILHYVTNDNDWVMIFLGSEIFFSGHSVPDHIWMHLAIEDIETILEWDWDFDNGYPDTLDELFQRGVRRE